MKMLDVAIAAQQAALCAQLDAALDAVLPPELLRQEALGESSLHYSYFLSYLALGVKRGLHPLAQQRQVDMRWMERLSSRFQWVARAQAWDDLCQRKELRALLRQALTGQPVKGQGQEKGQGGQAA